MSFAFSSVTLSVWPALFVSNLPVCCRSPLTNGWQPRKTGCRPVLSERAPEHGPRLIAQVYQPDEIAQARALGDRDIIWTLHRYAGQTHDVVDALIQTRPMAVIPMVVTIDQQRLASGLGLTLRRAGLCA